ncbi:MAG TPA: potassium channel family protein [Tepidisphaeraceae bacterium]|nr:potassium channel family protein [Tepidisphaeraceae bacterium]
MILGTLLGVALVILILIDAFETILQPRRVTHRYRFARLYYVNSWRAWRLLASAMPAGKKREATLGIFGPLSLLGLFLLWIIVLIFAFGLLQWSVETRLQTPDRSVDFATYLYLSGTTIFTLGYGDVVPLTGIGRTLAVMESGLGFAFLAVVIGYLPVLYGAYSLRETTISLLDARAGSPPSAAEVLRRAGRSGELSQLDPMLIEWEQWSAALLESQLSFPVLGFYRSQHDNQSWLAALTCMLDTCAVLMAMVKDCNLYRAQLTFAMARHTAVDLSLVIRATPDFAVPERLSAEQFIRLRQVLTDAGLKMHDGEIVAAKLTELRGMYEPFVYALSQRFLLALPPIIFGGEVIDNWQRSAGMRRAPGIENLPPSRADEHF